MPRREISVADIENRLSQLRTEQGKLAKAVTLSDDLPQLVVELDRCSARIRVLQKQLEAAERAPEEISAIIQSARDTAVTKLQNLQEEVLQVEDSLRRARGSGAV